MSDITFTFKEILFSNSKSNERIIGIKPLTNSLDITITYDIFYKERKFTENITTNTYINKVYKASVIGKPSYSFYHDINLLIIPEMKELFDIQITIEPSKLDLYDVLLSGYLDLERPYNYDNARSSISGEEGYVTSPSSPEIYPTIISKNIKSKLNQSIPMTWGKQAKFFPDKRTTSVFDKDLYIYFEVIDSNKKFFGVNNIKIIIAHYKELLKEETDIKDIYDPFGDGTGIMLFDFERIINDKIYDKSGRYYLELHGDISLSDGKYGNSLDLVNKPNSTYTIVKPKVKRYGINAITISWWMYVPNHTGSWVSIYHLTPNNSNNSSGNSRQPAVWLYSSNNKKLHVRNDTVSHSNWGIDASNGEINYNEWNHIATVISNKQIRLYINGNLTDTFNSSEKFKYNDGWLYIGDPWSIKNYKIDKFRVILRDCDNFDIISLYTEKIKSPLYLPDLNWLAIVFKNMSRMQPINIDYIKTMINSGNYTLFYEYRDILDLFGAKYGIRPFDVANARYIIIYEEGSELKTKIIYW